MLDVVVDAMGMAHPDSGIVRIEIGQGPDYAFDLSPLDALHGVPVTLKINIDVEGQANSNGVVNWQRTD